MSSALNDLTGMWIPDLHYVYGDNLKALGLDDNRTLDYETRLMITNNYLAPRVFEVTKIIDVSNPGIIKYSIKQDEVDETRDNIELGICDYYNKTGELQVKPPEENTNPETYIGSIKEMMLVDDELTENPDGTGKLKIGVASYFKGEFSSEFVDPEWHVELVGDNYTDEERKYYSRLIKINEFDHSIISVKPGKASSLKGKQFKLVVSDINGNYYATYDLEVEA